jgi:hypothetical protein
MRQFGQFAEMRRIPGKYNCVGTTTSDSIIHEDMYTNGTIYKLL